MLKNTVAIQGIRGSYSEEAARKLFGKEAEILEFRNFEDTFDAVLTDRARYAVVPLKNKIVGEISSATRVFYRTNLKILDELALEVRHVLVGTEESSLKGIRSVRSHIEAFKQCRKFLEKNKKINRITGADTASSIRRILLENNPTNAAIGSYRAAGLYKAKILKENIADDRENITTFYLIGN